MMMAVPPQEVAWNCFGVAYARRIPNAGLGEEATPHRGGCFENLVDPSTRCRIPNREIVFKTLRLKAQRRRSHARPHAP